MVKQKIPMGKNENVQRPHLFLSYMGIVKDLITVKGQSTRI